MEQDRDEAPAKIAVVGLSGRFPGADSVAEYWANLVAGIESIRFFSDEEWDRAAPLRRAHGGDEADVVRARGILDGADLFDADFFGYRPRDAAVMDPQQRLFLEQSWAALEHAGYDPGRYDGAIGVYGGVSRNTYLLNNVLDSLGQVDGVDDRLTETGNERDYVATRVAYKMDLHGPAVAVYSACSTSLLAVHYACQDLLSFQCDMALAGGASVRVPQVDGYIHSEGSILSTDGHCRPFDRDASGTNVGDGVGVVALKRLDEAVRDGDTIWAVVAGSAVNNDGYDKLSFMAPSVEGQAEVIAAALAAADVRPDEISYVECHGTGTPLGDPIEVEGLRQAFGRRDGRPCWIGSVKSNIGHLDAAAGIAGFIKVVLALHHKQLPATLHYRHPNPECRLDDGAFSVVPATIEWDGSQGTRRAGVSAFGLGGTNVHAILEEAPEQAASEPGLDRSVVLPVSARSQAALADRWRDLAHYLTAPPPGVSLEDIAHTLSAGRRHFDHRGFVMGRSIEEAAVGARAREAYPGTVASASPVVALLHPGDSARRGGMGRRLLLEDEVFRAAFQRCDDIAAPLLGRDLSSVILEEEPADPVSSPRFGLPALFAVEYALAEAWGTLGVAPTIALAQGVGEYVAACRAGVLSIEDALALACERGRLFDGVEAAEMLAVPLSEEQAEEYVGPSITLVSIDGPTTCVLAGSRDDLTRVANQLEDDGLGGRFVGTSQVVPPGSADALLDTFRHAVLSVTLRPARTPYVSTATGRPVTDEEVMDATYWVRQLQQPVRLSDGLGSLLDAGVDTFLEVGPGRQLSDRVRALVKGDERHAVAIASMPRPSSDEASQLLEAAAWCWNAGVDVEWTRLRTGSSRRVPLPTYPFERARHWIDAGPRQGDTHQQGRNVTDSTVSHHAADPADDGAESSRGAQPAADRTDRILNELLEIFRHMSGLEIDAADVDTRFQDLGFDSLFLAQANAELRSRFNVRIGFRQLLDDASTPAALAKFIAATMPPDEPRSVPSAPEVGVAGDLPRVDADGVAIAGAGGPLSQQIASITSLVSEAPDGLALVAQKHLELMEAQLRLLDGAAAARTPTGATSVGTSVTDTVVATDPVKGSFEPIRVTVGATPSPRPSATLSDRQQDGIATLTARYGARTRKSKEFAEEARPHLADNRAIVGYRTAWKDLAYQVVTSESRGSRIWDIDGNEYIDVMNSMGANLLGHRFEPIVEAVEGLLHRGFEVGPQTTLARDVADQVCAMTGADRLTFAHTGCEAVQYAVRMARAASGRNKVVFFEGDVHGRGDLFIARSFEVDGQLRTMPTAPGVPRNSVSESLVLQYGTERALEVLRASRDDVAAVLVEPVRTRNPDLQPIEFLREVRRITEESGICLIFDEVVTGFRLHPGGAQAYFDIDADIATYGKVLGGGLPIGAVAGRSEFLDYADGGVWSFGDGSVPESPVTRVGGTMIKHPLSLAAAKAVLDTLEAAGPGLQRELNRQTTEFAEDLNARFVEAGVPIHIEQFASYFKPVFLGSPEFEPLLYAHLRDRGIHAYSDFPCFFTAAHSDTDYRQVADAFVDATREMAEHGLLDQRPKVDARAIATPGHKDEGVVTGTLPLLPNQYRFLVERESPHANSWGIFGVRTCRARLDEDHLRATCRLLIRQHDALRMRLRRQGDDWRIFLDEPREDVPFSVHRFEIDDPAEAESLLEDEVKRLRSAISLSEGPLMRMALFDFGEIAPQRVFLMINHLACDGLSWIRLWEDLEAAYDHVSRGSSWHPPKTESYRTWAHRLDALAQEPATLEQVDDWLALPWASVRPLPRDFDVDAGQNLNESVSILQVTFDPDVSKALDRVRVDYRADLLVGAIARAVSEWNDDEAVLLDVLGHGREEELFDDADVSRTVGFFAWYTPYVLEPRRGGSDEDWTAEVLPQIDAIRRKGTLSHDLLRYLSRDAAVSDRMRRLPHSEILVNWQGRFDGVFPETSLFDDQKDPGRASDMPEGKRAYLLSIRGDIIDGQWVVTFVYSRNIHRQETIEQLAGQVRQALEQAAHGV